MCACARLTDYQQLGSNRVFRTVHERRGPMLCNRSTRPKTCHAFADLPDAILNKEFPATSFPDKLLCAQVCSTWELGTQPELARGVWGDALRIDALRKSIVMQFLTWFRISRCPGNRDPLSEKQHFSKTQLSRRGAGDWSLVCELCAIGPAGLWARTVAALDSSSRHSPFQLELEFTLNKSGVRPCTPPVLDVCMWHKQSSSASCSSTSILLMCIPGLQLQS